MNKRIASRGACTVVALFAAIALPAQTFTSVMSFDGTNGANPYYVSLIQGLDGNFYGTTNGGGANTYGTVFKITPEGTLTTVHSFDGIRGSSPEAGLALGPAGNFYGTTSEGGLHHNGTIFRLALDGSLSTLHSFDAADGANPLAALVQGDNGSFYGTTLRDGANGYGTVFEITPAGVLTTLQNFDNTNGANPEAAPAQTSNGNLIGTTSAGGADGHGTIFTIALDGTLTTLQSFSASEGSSPFAGLVLATDGNFYGTTQTGGAHGPGTVFKITPRGALTILHSFTGDEGDAPGGPLVQATDGNFYGTTSQGGSGCGACGTVFSITPSGSLITLHSFNESDGADPVGGLLQGTDGNFYGVTYGGGSLGDGTVFRLSLGLGPFVKTLPLSGKIGANVIILGTDLSSATDVSFNGISAMFTRVSATEITATVPAGAATGPVQVTMPGGTLLSNVPFRVR